MMFEGTPSLTFGRKGLNWRLCLPTVLESQHTHTTSNGSIIVNLGLSTFSWVFFQGGVWVAL